MICASCGADNRENARFCDECGAALAVAFPREQRKTVTILFCDLRDFTKISDNWPRDDVIELLNGYFDAMSEPIARHGGEILKFIGDGLLAIFPLSEPSACANLLHAVVEARQAMVDLNEKNSETGRAPLNYGIGIHVGDVMYGNIGSRTRLDFTVIGPAVNMASRLETLTKQVGRPVLLSFYRYASCPICNLRVRDLRQAAPALQAIEYFDRRSEEASGVTRHPGVVTATLVIGLLMLQPRIRRWILPAPVPDRVDSE